MVWVRDVGVAGAFFSRVAVAVNFNVVGESSSVYLERPFKIVPQVPLECASQIATS